MKKCPNCQKEFPDTMRFCQTDGTPLVDVVEPSQPEDPLKTTVVRQEDIASAIPSSDPFKTVVASSGSSQKEEDDLLQLPEQDFDPLKTMVASPIGMNKPPAEEPKPEPPKFGENREEVKFDSSPFSGFSQPKEPLPEPPKDLSNEPTEFQPEPPKFNEPKIAPPSFGSSSKDEEDLPQTVMQNPWDNPPKADSPFSKPNDAPASSPFDMSKPFEAPKSAFDEPQSPFNQPASPFEAPSSFDQPKDSGFNQPPSYGNQPSSFDQPKTSFDEPASNQFGSAAAQFEQMNQNFGGADQQLQQQNEWNAPPAPDSSWQEQGIGANTPFQPPVAGAGGQSKSLAFISLALGIIALLSLLPTLLIWLCGVIPVLFGIGAVITGFLARSRANQNPAQYGGAGLGMIGIIAGGLSILATIGIVILTFVFVASLSSFR